MKISTITLNARLNSKLDLNKIKELNIFEIVKKDNIFMNSIICKMDNKNMDNKVKFKIFSNGSLQITGVKLLEKIHEIPQYIYEKLENNKDVILDKELYRLSDIKVSMIRMCSNLKKSVDLIKLKNYVNEMKVENVNAAFYSPERFSGLILKYKNNDNKGTIIVFSTGNYSLISNNIETINNMNEIFKIS